MAVYSKSVRDQVLDRIYVNACDDECPLVEGDIVRGSTKVCAEFHIGPSDAVHFRKTYHSGAGGNPKDEYERSLGVWSAIPEHAAKPLGFSDHVFRSALVNGTAWAALSPFALGQNYISERQPEKITAAAAQAFWGGLEKLYAVFSALHATHAHGDAHRNNALFVTLPDGSFEPKLIDFEDSVDLSKLSPSARKEAIAEDLIELLMEAHLMQKHLFGPQHSPLGNAARLAHAPEVGIEIG